MLRPDRLSQAGSPRYRRQDGTTGAVDGSCRTGSLPPGFGSLAAWGAGCLGSGLGSSRRAVAWSGPRQPGSASLTRVISGASTLVTAGPIRRPAAVIAAIGHVQLASPLLGRCFAARRIRDQDAVLTASGSPASRQVNRRCGERYFCCRLSNPGRARTRGRAALVPPRIPGPAAARWLGPTREGPAPARPATGWLAARPVAAAHLHTLAKYSRQLLGSRAQPR